MFLVLCEIRARLDSVYSRTRTLPGLEAQQTKTKTETKPKPNETEAKPKPKPKQNQAKRLE
jgi:hypothetical protein